ncbi:SLA/LP autoantigen-like protein [Leishmania major strain Friedlin]|uniref:O-phosphoseryl-tRNA(Sec) selenium transferase n=1 Tax=Leishmania major TaxID=5664 RepID=Q4QHS9_LEIMA|nr:SLA/LP autoantigen-like protein [Leishmania major strain Friedlin]CAG9569710.1 O-phosphoseryl-tRNA(Sec)_selenium_transferase [Leishmania major strain Friedlin]CAJ02785.1 SLA/LP autoantigen-like protein [Leishmania major strain Friedlin]|eukprot:XP_001681269.1 SLA/LP autoantigen-like protein [Leishmania major strain Friedlin]
MDDRSLKLAEDFVSARYIDAGRESLRSTARILRSILAQRCCPDEGLTDAAIELILRQLSLMDTNNFARHVGGGEREGRVVSALVRMRHFHLTHGVGRSGDLFSEQPKAAGSSLLYKITNVLMLDLIRQAGAPSTAAAVVVPMATGMTLALVLRCVAKTHMKELMKEAEAVQLQRTATKDSTSAASAAPAQEPPMSEADRGRHGRTSLPVPATPRYVIWPRIDQKTALKCIDAAGLVPVPVQLRPAVPLARSAALCASTNRDSLDRGQDSIGSPSTPTSSSSLFLECHVDDVAAAVSAVGGPSQVVCVLSTTSCFAPRLPDNTVAIAQYCKKAGIPYVVNNAYGVQSRRIMTRLDAAQRLGRVDFVVQSGDKNFLVPVGGSIICSSDKERCKAVTALYAGRASMSPIVDLFITALSLGRRGMQALWSDRYKCRARLIRQLRVFARERREVLLVDDTDDDKADEDTVGGSQKTSNAAAPRNDISVAVTMRAYGLPAAEASSSGAQRGSEQVGKVTNWAAARALGAQLFRSAVTGPRVITPAPSTPTTIAGCTFRNYGMHQDREPPCPLLVIACGIGMSESEGDALMARLRDLWPVPT